MIGDLAIEGDAGRNPLFDVMLVSQDDPSGFSEYELSTLESYLYTDEDAGRRQIKAKFDLSFIFGRDTDGSASCCTPPRLPVLEPP